ncbi:MAG: AHH domain-containing protein [Bacteroidota bacterium]|nr:AHH domain-containing protein [Bacteroidota bacterium]
MQYQHFYYYAFGMDMPGRDWHISNYRYSMNGQEKDDEIFSGAMSAENWEYDSRIGRRWNTDPIVYEWQSPYSTFNDNPIYFADPDGLYGDPPSTITKATKTASQLGKGTTALDIQFKAIENSLGTVSKTAKAVSVLSKATNVLGSLTFYLSSANSDYKGPGANNGGSEVIGNGFDFSPMEKITLDPSQLTSQYLLDVKARVEMGKGSFNDHQLYNKTFAPKVQVPYLTQSHHVIPVAVFEDIAGSELVASAMQDPNFKKWANGNEMNRIPLGDDVHGNHPAYSDYVRGQIRELEAKYGSVSSVEAAKLLEQLAGKLKGEITQRLQLNPGKRLNEVFGGGRSTQSSKKPTGHYETTRTKKATWQGRRKL